MPSLTDEIIRADGALKRSEELMAEAGRQLRSARIEHRKCREELSRAIQELRSGETRYPLFERYGFGGVVCPPNGDAEPSPETVAKSAITEDDAAFLTVQFAKEAQSKSGKAPGTDELDAAILGACKQIGWNGESGHWELLRGQGCDDARILEVLRGTWPELPMYFFAGEWGKGFTIRGGVKPAIFLGKRELDQPHLLAGLELADRVRRVLEIPRAPEPEPAAEPDQARKRPRKRAAQ